MDEEQERSPHSPPSPPSPGCMMRIAMGIYMQLCRLRRCVTPAHYTTCLGIAYSPGNQSLGGPGGIYFLRRAERQVERACGVAASPLSSSSLMGRAFPNASSRLYFTVDYAVIRGTDRATVDCEARRNKIITDDHHREHRRMCLRTC